MIDWSLIAAWVGAAGSILAAVVALWIALADARRSDRLRREDAQDAERQRREDLEAIDERRLADLAAIEKRRRDDRNRDQLDRQLADLDECRRLLYMIHSKAGKGMPPEVRGSLVNALVHHSGLLGVNDAIALATPSHWPSPEAWAAELNRAITVISNEADRLRTTANASETSEPQL